MLNIPQTVKDLFAKSSVKKKLNISFPNGEIKEVTEKNIIQETMSFTESVCSQDNLKFGLVESPVLNFETVGIGNMKGYTIDASIDIDIKNTYFEIDVINGVASISFVDFFGKEYPADQEVYYTTKGNANILSIAATSQPGTQIVRDGVSIEDEVSEYSWSARIDIENLTIKTDSDYNGKIYFVLRSDFFYSVPLGQFVVDSCPKQSDMTRRNVTAYGISYEQLNKLSPIEIAKRNVACAKNNKYKVNAEKFYISNIPGDYFADNFSKLDMSSFCNESSTDYGSYFRVNDLVYSINTVGNDNSLYYIDHKMNQSRVDAIMEEIKYKLSTILFLEDEEWDKKILSQINTALDEIFYPSLHLMGKNNNLFIGTLAGGYNYIYPFNNSGIDYVDGNRLIRIPKSITLYYPDGRELYTFSILSDEESKLYDITISDWHDIDVSIDRIKSGGSYVAPIDELPVLPVIQGFLELEGSFGKYNRHGNFEKVETDKNLFELSGGVIDKSKIASIWFDDAESLPYGFVSATYRDKSDEEQYMSYNIVKSITRNNLELLKEVQADAEVYFQYLNVSTGTMLPESGNLVIESPYPIDTAYVGLGYGYFPIEFEENATTIDISSDDFYFPDITEIGVILKTQESYSGNVTLSSYDRLDNYYKENEAIRYDLSSNFLIQNSTFSEEEMAEILEKFAESIKNIVYMPCNVEMVGLPYIEAGDFATFQTRTSSITTIIERRTLTGITALMDSVESKASNENIKGNENSYVGSGGGSSSGGGAVTSVNGYVGDVVLKTSDLVNNSGYVSDANYVHTDNNFTNEYKEKLDNLTPGGSGGDSTMRYVEETDYIQCLVGGVWMNYQKAGFKKTYLFVDGDECTDITGGYDTNNYKRDNANGTAAPTKTITDGLMTFTAKGVEGSGFANNAIDLTNFTKLVVVFDNVTLASSGHVMVGFVETFATRYTFETSQTVSASASNLTVEVNVSELSGSHFLIFNLLKSGTVCSIEEIYLQ